LAGDRLLFSKERRFYGSNEQKNDKKARFARGRAREDKQKSGRAPKRAKAT
jgi:hypothetical protein